SIEVPFGGFTSEYVRFVGAVLVSVAVLVTTSCVSSPIVRFDCALRTGAVLAQQTRPLTPTASMRQPLRPLPLSVPQRQRNCTLCPLAEGGKLTTVVTKPAEVPLQARRPPSGLLKLVLIVCV